MPVALKPFASSDELTQLLCAFEAARIVPADFHHREHLAVALWYCRQHPAPEALNRMREGLENLLARHGLPEAYNEATTQLWMQRVTAFVHSQPPETDFLTAANKLLLVA